MGTNVRLSLWQGLFDSFLYHEPQKAHTDIATNTRTIFTKSTPNLNIGDAPWDPLLPPHLFGRLFRIFLMPRPPHGCWPGHAVRSETADLEGVWVSLSSCWQASQTCGSLDTANLTLCGRFPPSRISPDACPCQTCPNISAILIGVPESHYFNLYFPHFYWTGRCSLPCEFLELASACFNEMWFFYYCLCLNMFQFPSDFFFGLWIV